MGPENLAACWNKLKNLFANVSGRTGSLPPRGALDPLLGTTLASVQSVDGRPWSPIGLRIVAQSIAARVFADLGTGRILLLDAVAHQATARTDEEKCMAPAESEAQS